MYTFLMFLGQEDDSDDDQCDSSSDDSEIGEEKVIAEFCQVSNIEGVAPLGDWERHTRVRLYVANCNT